MARTGSNPRIESKGAMPMASDCIIRIACHAEERTWLHEKAKQEGFPCTSDYIRFCVGLPYHDGKQQHERHLFTPTHNENAVNATVGWMSLLITLVEAFEVGLENGKYKRRMDVAIGAGLTIVTVNRIMDLNYTRSPALDTLLRATSFLLGKKLVRQKTGEFVVA